LKPAWFKRAACRGVRSNCFHPLDLTVFTASRTERWVV
jgi:hypothetical protein